MSFPKKDVFSMRDTWEAKYDLGKKKELET